MDKELTGLCGRAADLLARADSLIICAGSGMSAESRLASDDTQLGTWPALAWSGGDLIRGEAFQEDPERAWDWWGQVLESCRQLTPHRGFGYLLEIASHLPRGYAVYTSAIDGQFRRAGFDPSRIVETLGSVHHLQCSAPCCSDVWMVDDPRSGLLHGSWQGEVPLCVCCGDVAARPNVLMGQGDASWVSRRTDVQHKRSSEWLGRCRAPVTIEIGAGAHMDAVRRFAEQQRGPLIRIHPERAQVLKPGVAIRANAEEALEALFEVMSHRGFFGEVEEVRLGA